MCPGLSSEAPNPGVDSEMWWSYGPSPRESQQSRSALGTSGSHQQVLPENPAAVRIDFLNPVVIFSICQPSSCSPWLPSWWQVPAYACQFLWGSQLFWRKDVTKRGEVEEIEVCPFLTEIRASIWKIHLHFIRKAIGELAWWLGNSGLRRKSQSLVPGLFLYFNRWL